METVTLAFGIGLLLAGAAVVWLLVERSRLAVLAATAVAERDGAGAELATARAEVASLKGQDAQASARVSQMETHVAVLTEKIAVIEAGRREDLVQSEERVKQAEATAQQLAQARLDSASETLAAARKLVADNEKAMRDAFSTLSAQALQANSAQFLTLAQQTLGGTLAEGAAAVKQQRDAVETLVKPMGDTLRKTDEKLAAIEKERTAAYAAITTQIEQMSQQGAALQRETGQLVRALRDPKVRGRYGEYQLKRVVEIAGMRAYCDFNEQDTTRDAEGNALRPDMVMKLPNGREIVIDAKTNTQHYTDAFDAHADPALRDDHLKRFADGVATQVRALGGKRYWAQYEGSPDFVIMFIPGDVFVDAALARRPDLLEMAANSGVILASPSTLIGLLRAVAVGFRERVFSENAQQLFELCKEFHERATKALSFVEGMGGSIRGLIKDYNGFVGSYESRLEPTMRKVEELGGSSGKALPEITVVQADVRTLTARAEA
ncbi:MAG: DNA recombination protein RmuC [Phycisphaerales bacterium]